MEPGRQARPSALPRIDLRERRDERRRDDEDPHKGTLPFPKLAPRAVAYRLTFTAASQGVNLKGAVDLILLGKGRIDAVMISVSFGTPPLADEQRLAALMAHRL